MNYTFITPEGDYIQATNPDGSTFTFNEQSPHYAVYLNSGQTASAYVAPPAPPEPTAEEKLANAGLTVDELKELLGI
jgi:hypothetical protein